MTPPSIGEDDTLGRPAEERIKTWYTAHGVTPGRSEATGVLGSFPVLPPFSLPQSTVGDVSGALRVPELANISPVFADKVLNLQFHGAAQSAAQAFANLPTALGSDQLPIPRHEQSPDPRRERPAYLPTGLGGPTIEQFSAVHGDDPVNPATGELVLRRTDLALSGVGVPFRLARVYRSRWSYRGVLGHGWTHSYDQRIDFGVTPCGRPAADWYTGDGAVIRFERSALGNWLAPRGLRFTMVTVPPRAVEVIAPDGVRLQFDTSDGSLNSISEPNGNTIQLKWSPVLAGPSAPLRLDEVTDTVGRKLQFHYRPDGYLEQVEVLETGLSVRYDVDANGDLVAAINAGGFREFVRVRHRSGARRGSRDNSNQRRPVRL